MILKNKAKNKQKIVGRDPEKEKLIKTLSEQLKKSGLIVRREELKRGPGWKARSGDCQMEGKKTVFVDSRLSLNEQIDFLNLQIQQVSREGADVVLDAVSTAENTEAV